MMNTRKAWTLFFGVCAVVATALCVFFAVPYGQPQPVLDNKGYGMTLENYNKESLYQLSEDLINIEVNLGKVGASNNTFQQIKYLSKVESQAQNLTEQLSLMPVMYGKNTEKFIKYANQLDDYCKNLTDKLVTGTQLTNGEKSNLVSLSNVCAGLTKQINAMVENEQFFIANSDGQNGGNVYYVDMDTLDQKTFDYPALNYDGPYSDSRVDKALQVKEPTTQQTDKNILHSVFGSYDVKSIAFESEFTNRGATCRIYEVECDSNVNYRVMMTSDGRILQFNAYRQPQDDDGARVNADACKSQAEKFVNTVGYNVQPVWVSEPTGGKVFVTMCPVVNSFIYYSDMVKVAVDANSGRVVGLDATQYLLNYTLRNTPSKYKSEAQAMKKLASGLEVVGVAKAVIPVGEKEYCVWEFQCEKQGKTIFVYIDMQSLEERNIFVVAQGANGEVLK